MLNIRPALGILIAVVLVLTTACYANLVSQLKQNKTKWDAAQINNYEFDQKQDCFCERMQSEMPLHVVVRNNLARSVTDATGQEVDDEHQAGMDPLTTLDNFLAWLDDAIKRNPARIVITYDPQCGFPADVWISEDPQVTDSAASIPMFNFHVEK
jgi:hypothetical protein